MQPLTQRPSSRSARPSPCTLVILLCSMVLAPDVALGMRDPDGSVHACGFSVADAPVSLWDGPVPLAVDPGAFSRRVHQTVLHARRRTLHEHHTANADCPRTKAFIQDIVKRLIRGSHLEEAVAAEPPLKLVVSCSMRTSLPVARAAGGHVILVPSTLPALATSTDAVAAVIAHELAHVTLRHVERLIHAFGTRQPNPGNPSPGADIHALKRAHEREADITGLKLLVNAGYDPTAAMDHLRLVDEHARRVAARRSLHRANHDSPETRLRLLKQQMLACGYVTASPRIQVALDVQWEIQHPSSVSNPTQQPDIRASCPESDVLGEWGCAPAYGEWQD